MFVRGLEIERAGDGFAVAEPAADDVFEVAISQLSLPTLPHRMERLGPRLQPSLDHDPNELSPHVLSRVAIPSDEELVFGVERLFQVRAKITEQRDRPLAVSVVVRSLRGRDVDRVGLPVNIASTQGQCLGRRSEATEATEGHDQPPL